MIAKLHYITQGKTPADHLLTLQMACEAGCDWVQLRLKNLSIEQLFTYAKQANEICDKYGTSLIINDFPEVVKELNISGVHLGLQDLPTDKAREMLGSNTIIGGTANTLDDILYHAANGVDYVGVGPFSFTTTKEKLSPVLGLEGYYSIMEELDKRAIKIPVIAIGGIQLYDIEPILKTGVHGIAVSGLIAKSENPPKTINQIKNLLS